MTLKISDTVELKEESTIFDSDTLFQSVRFIGNVNKTIIDNQVDKNLMTLYKQGYGIIEEINGDTTKVKWFFNGGSCDKLIEIPISELQLGYEPFSDN